MCKSITLGDFLTEAQLRTLVKDYQVEQKHGTDNRSIGGSRAPKRRHSELSGVEAVRARVQWERHKKQRGEWVSKKPYLSFKDACDRYERRHERLESGDEIFAIMQGQSTRKKADIRAHATKANRPCPGIGGRIVRRPTIDEGKGSKPIRIKRERTGVRSGWLV